MYYLDIDRLASLVRKKRANKVLREVAMEISGVSPSTISRVENGKIPDMENFLLLCNWLKVAPAEFFKNVDDIEPGSTPDSTPDAIALLLQSDKNLDPAMANVLASLIKAAYSDLLRY